MSEKSTGGFWAVAVLVGIAATVFLFTNGLRSADSVDALGAEWLEVPATAVEFETLDGGSESLASYRGRVVILNLWGTWCPPCRREIPELVILQDSLPQQDFTVLSIAVDSGSEEGIRNFAAEFGVDYPIWVAGTDDVVREFQAIGFPYTVLIDRDGIIRKQYLGPQTYETLLSDVEFWINEGSETDNPT